MLKRLIRTAISSPLILAVIVVTVPLSGCGLRQPPATARSSAAIAPRVPSGSEKFADATSDLEAALEAASRGFAKGSVDTTALAGIRSFSGKLTKLDRGVRADFAKARKVLQKIDSPEKNAIQKRVERQYEQRSETLRTKLYDIEQARGSQETSVAVASLAEWLVEINPDPPMQPLGTELPHRIVDRKAGPPVIGTAIAPAYAPDTPGAIPSTLPVEPTPEDLAETIEVQFSPEIRSLATSLGNDPVRMYEWVRNNIDFDPYHLSRRGSQEVLLEHVGNSSDQASLLLALYRSSGIPARYVHGVVDVPVEDVRAWLRVADAGAAAALLSASGIPVRTVKRDGITQSVAIAHTWVEASVSYEDYRGGDNGRRRWIPLDPSFKRYSGSSTPQRHTPAPELVEGLRSALESATVDDATSSIRGIDVDSLTAALSSQLQETSPTVRVRVRERPQLSNAGVLPGSLPVKVAGVGDEFRALPASLQERMTIELPGIRESWAVSQLAGHRVSVVFEARDAASKSVVEDAGQIEDIPAYLVQVSPVLEVDAVPVAVGLPSDLGSTVELSTWLSSAHGVPCVDSLMAGGLHTLSVDSGRVGAHDLSSRLQALERGHVALQQASSNPDAPFRPDEFLSEIVGLPAQLYFAQVSLFDEIVPGGLGLRASRGVSLAVTGTQADVSSALGVPRTFAPSGFYIDVDRDAVAVVPDAGSDSGMVRNYALISGANASALEHRVWEAVIGADKYTASTVKGLALAAKAGIPLHSVTSSNADAVLAELDVPDNVKDSIAAAAAAGDCVTVPRQSVTDGPLTYVPFIVEDPTTGSTGFMLSSGMAGGEGSTQSSVAGGGGGIDPVETGLNVSIRMGLQFMMFAARLAGAEGIAGVTFEIAAGAWITWAAKYGPVLVGVASAFGAMYVNLMRVSNSTRLTPEEKAYYQQLIIGSAVANAKMVIALWLIGMVKEGEFSTTAILGGLILSVSATTYWGLIMPTIIDSAESD